MGKILEQLGIYGIPESTENSILASLTLGDPALLIGAPGTCKSDCAQMIGSALRERTKKKYPDDASKWLSFQIYDASKLEYEDLLGIPNPTAMSQGRMEFIRTPTTIWGKTLVCYDEFNRTNPDRQSNLLEHIRSRRMQGIPTGTKFILAAMNPYGDTGTEELSDALVDRFLFYLEFPEFSDFHDNTKDAVIEKIGQSDCVALKHYWKNADRSLDVNDELVEGRPIVNEMLANTGDSIGRCIQRSMTLYGKVQEENGAKITSLVRKTFDSMNEDIEQNEERVSLLSGRRAGLVRRGLIAHRAVELAKAEIYGTEVRAIIDMLREVYPTCMPFGVSGRSSPESISKSKNRLYDDISSFWPTIESESSGNAMTDYVYELFRSKSLHRQLYILLKYGDKLGDQVKTEAWTTLAMDERNNFPELLQIVATHLPGRIPENVQLPVPKRSDVGKMMLDNISSSYMDLRNDQVNCKRDLELLIDRWKDNPIMSYFTYSSISTALKDSKLDRESEIRRLIDDISLSAQELDKVLKECEEKTANV